MDKLSKLFLHRIGVPTTENVTFENLSSILEKTAREIPFENLCVIKNRTTDITKENLVNKILNRNEGGLCYELNTIFYLFLVENGFNANLFQGVTSDPINQQWSKTGRTHVVIIITYNAQQYLVDTGFGGNLPLKPVPLNGDTVKSSNGEFRVEKTNHEYGDYVLYMKLKHKHDDWKLGYAFDTTKVVKNLSELNEVQKIILEHPASRFNKKPLVTRLTERGNIILTDTSFTEWIDGKVQTKEIDKTMFNELIKGNFGMDADILESNKKGGHGNETI
ncbi:arylamine N-acetyltransferase family protein [Neobacillus cucumis]|uniref:arylamine N-acetyltransferase family protein n=1 Tax=Neobacillus cucumis TaxID=1740721 RepID=UPI00196351FB|nr:arylamine N-acetyltransferase [Neobacillus cucumis]MBM7651971.1 N-hydroxyarylamine O-acetyltransferase [Neobacillus cucumis]